MQAAGEDGQVGIGGGGGGGGWSQAFKTDKQKIMKLWIKRSFGSQHVLCLLTYCQFLAFSNIFQTRGGGNTLSTITACTPLPHLGSYASETRIALTWRLSIFTVNLHLIWFTGTNDFKHRTRHFIYPSYKKSCCPIDPLAKHNHSNWILDMVHRMCK